MRPRHKTRSPEGSRWNKDEVKVGQHGAKPDQHAVKMDWNGIKNTGSQTPPAWSLREEHWRLLGASGLQGEGHTNTIRYPYEIHTKSPYENPECMVKHSIRAMRAQKVKKRFLMTSFLFFVRIWPEYYDLQYVVGFRMGISYGFRMDFVWISYSVCEIRAR